MLFCCLRSGLEISYLVKEIFYGLNTLRIGSDDDLEGILSGTSHLSYFLHR
jgi:hypothetical protein